MNRDGARKPLAGKTALVTSGSRGVGAVTARMLDRMRPGVIEQRWREVGQLPATEDVARAIVDAAQELELFSGDTVYVGSID